MTDFTNLLERTFPDIIATGDAIAPKFTHDWAGLPPVRPLALARPRSTAEVSDLLRLCNEQGVPVVPMGGLTGISGGAHPRADAVALSLDRMNAIEEVDVAMGTLSAGAGVVLETAQAAATAHGLMLGIDIGARGSCMLGGVLATNAGGNQVIRYGMAKDHVLGVEAVLADGTILSSMNKMLKNNAGLDLKQLFIGTEGLLGVITRVVLRLQPRPAFTATALVGCAGSAEVIALLAATRRRIGPMLTSFEVMWPSFFDVMSRGANLPSPLAGRHGAYVIIEASGFDAASPRAAMEECLEAALETGLVEDAVLANSAREERGLWAVRESVSEYGTILGALTPFDVGLPLDRMAEAVTALEAAIAARWPDARALSYGHIGDSNLHLVVNIPSTLQQPTREVKALVYDIVRDLGGTVSAEHGIGAIKRDYLSYSRTEAEIATMRLIKSALDPKGILNPGKGFAA
ncbi:FAD-binding oxidoreductase [Falsirhodobacter sp. 1013]|uniref:FAD-binding oxidoreductase n=1 Tax=Falsirhodobacter sp. 1013 TaxID=3417566 RepID=UPI003EBB9BA9